MRFAEYGEGNANTIRVGLNYALNLLIVNRGVNAMDLLTKLLATSKQVHGPNHNITKEVASELKRIVAQHEVANQG